MQSATIRRFAKLISRGGRRCALPPQLADPLPGEAGCRVVGGSQSGLPCSACSRWVRKRPRKGTHGGSHFSSRALWPVPRFRACGPSASRSREERGGVRTSKHEHARASKSKQEGGGVRISRGRTAAPDSYCRARGPFAGCRASPSPHPQRRHPALTLAWRCRRVVRCLAGPRSASPCCCSRCGRARCSRCDHGKSHVAAAGKSWQLLEPRRYWSRCATRGARPNREAARTHTAWQE